MDDKLIAAQLRQPSGEVGKKVAENMNKGNAFLYQMAFDMMQIAPEDQVLEIGFGSGKYIKEAAMLASKGFVAGVDFSELMVEEATQYNQEYITQGRVEIKQSSVSVLPYPDERFTKVFTLNTIYFWPDPLKDIGEIYRVLKPGGKLYLGLRTEYTMKNHSFTKYGFQYYNLASVTNLLTGAGFINIQSRYEIDPNPAFDCLCVAAEK